MSGRGAATVLAIACSHRNQGSQPKRRPIAGGIGTLKPWGANRPSGTRPYRRPPQLSTASSASAPLLSPKPPPPCCSGAGERDPTAGRLRSGLGLALHAILLAGPQLAAALNLHSHLGSLWLNALILAGGCLSGMARCMGGLAQ